MFFPGWPEARICFESKPEGDHKGVRNVLSEGHYRNGDDRRRPTRARIDSKRREGGNCDRREKGYYCRVKKHDRRVCADPDARCESFRGRDKNGGSPAIKQ